ncbi:MAG: endolytic transglycosylase MltG [Clostridiales bacterium]|nr:endolytic transglycosylase MltG [Clostridiales bacterium]
MSEKRKSNKICVVIIVLLVFLLLAVIGFIAYTYLQKDIAGNSGSNAEYTLIIEQSDFQYQVADKLQSNDIIASSTLWCWWMDKYYPDFVFINGEYNLTSSMSYSEIADKLQNPDVSHKSVSVCIPEGYTVFDITETMEENSVCSSLDFLSACKSTDYDFDFLSDIEFGSSVAYPLEGFLFPATYDLAENTPATEVVATMLEAFDYRITAEWLSFCSENDFSLLDLITLASIVEKEASGSSQAVNVASVFINRLEVSQQLQSDVTVTYGNLLREAGFDDDVVFSYNTYKCTALPSGAICNPGLDSISAVVNHTSTDYYYFFTYNSGSDFYFTSTYSDFSQKWSELSDD